MKSGWQTKALGEVCSIASALVDPRLPHYAEMLHIGGANIQSETGELTDLKTAKEEGLKSGKFLFDPSMVLYSKIRPYLMKVARPEFVGLCSADIYPLSPNHAVLDRGYLYHQLLSPRFTDFAICGSARAGMPKVNRDHLFTFQIPLPPLPEQQRIVGILDEAFADIATAKANAEKNLQNARALFESHLHAVFTHRGPGWVETTLGDVCSFVGGSQPPKSVFVSEPGPDLIRLIQIRDYKSDKNVVYIPRSLARRFCDADDVMIGRYGPPIFQILRGLEGAYNVALMKAVPKEAKLDRDYLYYFLKNPDLLEYVIYHSARAAGQIGLTKETLEPYPLALPSLPEQRLITARLDALQTETRRLEALYAKKLAALDELKSALLHQAFSGQL
jgi:type I restriction enzyme, S subunit